MAIDLVERTDDVIQFVDDTQDPVEDGCLMALAETRVCQDLGGVDGRDRRVLQLHVDRDASIGMSLVLRGCLIVAEALGIVDARRQTQDEGKTPVAVNMASWRPAPSRRDPE